jgi:hypothetical protein
VVKQYCFAGTPACNGRGKQEKKEPSFHAECFGGAMQRQASSLQASPAVTLHFLIANS